MSNYFNDVYLKRLNHGGTTRQDRIKTRKEVEFDRLFMKRTEYLVTLYQVNDERVDVQASLQPNKWNESNLIGNLLMSTSAAPLKTGDILYIKQKIKDKEWDKIWIIIYKEDNLTKGHQSYKVICLDSEINLIDEYGTTRYSAPAKYTNNAQSFMQDTNIRNAHELGYEEPFTTNIILTQDNPELMKGSYFNFMGRGWQIVGKNNIAIPNVAYLYVSERLVRDNEPLSSEDILVGENDNFFLNGV